MAGPVSELVKRGTVISGSVLECIFRRQMDAVAGAIVESLVGLVVSDLRAGIVQNLLCRIHDFKWSWSLWLIFRDALDLLGIKYGVHAVDEPGVPPVPPVTGVTAFGIVAGRCFFLGGLHIPELNLGTLL